MRKILVTAAAAFVAGGIATGAVLSQAQPARPMGPPDGGPGWHHPMERWEARWGHGPAMHPPFARPGLFALIYQAPDRKLTPDDVKKIAEAFLLWHGNHTWKVIDVAPTAAGPIGFDLATQSGAVVAKFTMDPHTGRLNRVE